MCLFEFLKLQFPEGIEYEDAVQICMALYCSDKWVPGGIITESLSIHQIADAFSDFAKSGLIRNCAPHKSVLYGANYHAVEDKGHWIEVQASILKFGKNYDVERVKMLLRNIQQT